MEQNKHRFEFRAWSYDFGNIGSKIESISQSEIELRSQETYIISIEHSLYNIKIRDEYLDIKQLVETDRGLEHWRPYLKEAFPLTSAFLVEKVIPILGVVLPTKDILSYSAQNFMNILIQPSEKWVVVLVDKHRFKYMLENCIVEKVEVEVNNIKIISFAIESYNADSVLELVNQLEFNTYENLSYPAAIKRILGLSGGML